MADDTIPLDRLEAVIFAADEIASVTTIRRALPALTPSVINKGVAEINEALARDGRPYEIVEVAGGYQFRTRPAFSDLIRSSQRERKLRLSRPALETLAVVAYRQPITRAEIEELRCVDCGAVLKSLLDRDLIRIVGRRDAPGRPALYGSSSNFLSVFGLGSLRDLPTLRELSEMLESQGSPGASGGEPSEQAEPGEQNESLAESVAAVPAETLADASQSAPDAPAVSVESAEPEARAEQSAPEIGAEAEPAARKVERASGRAPEPEGEVGI